jgi:hypothetical protein
MTVSFLYVRALHLSDDSRHISSIAWSKLQRQYRISMQFGHPITTTGKGFAPKLTYRARNLSAV